MTISAINLGNTFTNAKGTTVLGGLSSGINTSAIIDSIVAAQTAQVTKLNDSITVNNNQVTALNTLNQFLTQLKSDTALLSTPQSPNSASNVFASSTAQVTANTTLPASNYLTANVTSVATAGTYTISGLSQIATATTQETSAFSLPSTSGSVVAATSTAGMFTAGTITFKSGATVTLTAGESLANVAAAFNAVTTGTNATGITASIVQTASGTPNNTYKLVFTGTSTGAANAFNMSPPGAGNTITSDPSGVLTNITFTTDQAAQDAMFKFNGVSVVRPTNNVSDLVSGVTFNLLQNTASQPTASFTVAITPDTTKIATAIQSFVTDYNNFLTFYAQQTQIDPTTNAPAKTAVLNSDSTLRNAFYQLTGYASSIVSGVTGVKSLADIGISFSNQAATSTTPAVYNMLTINNSTLATAINTNLTGVQNVFGFNGTSSSTNLSVYSGPLDQTISNFTVNVDQVNNVYTATYTDSSSVQHTINLTKAALGTSGLSLTAPTTSALNGLVFIYTGSTSQSGITVTTTNGVASKMNGMIAGAIAPTTGLIAVDQNAIALNTTTTQTNITNINTQIANTRNSLLQKFSKLEAAIAAANRTLNYMNAQQMASSSGG